MLNKLKKNKNNIVFKNFTVSQAIRALDKVEHKTLVVLDQNEKIVGTLTDGDIRRGILKGFSLTDKIFGITNKNPIKKVIGKNFLNINIKKDIDIIPIVDKFSKFKSVEIYKKKNFLERNRDILEIVLMAGGYGKRLMPLTKNIPKPLLKIKNKSLLEIAMAHLKEYGFLSFNISTFYKSKIIKNYFNKKKLRNVKIKYLEEKSPLGTAGCLSLLSYKSIKDYILVFNGDVISDININNLVKFHTDTKSDITVCAKEFSNTSPFGEIFFKGHKIKKIIEKQKKKNFVNAGIYLINKKMIKNMAVIPIDMTDFIASKIKKGHSVNIYPIYEYWVDVGRKEIFKKILEENK